MEKIKMLISRQVVLAVVATVGGLWVLGALLGLFDKPQTAAVSPGSDSHQAALSESGAQAALSESRAQAAPAEGHAQAVTQTPADSHAPTAKATPADSHAPAAQATPADSHAPAATHSTASAKQAAPSQDSHAGPVATGTEPHDTAAADAAHPQTATTGHGTAMETAPVKLARGVSFIDACIEPMQYELGERFWGWRPNDILDFTDNVNNYQLGVLEVTRRTAVILAERVSRTGSTAAFDPNLETAMNWFMIKADRYWFPSPESKYKAGLEELKEYRDNLQAGKAPFYTRTDNLIPLLLAYEDLLGSCDDNLVKQHEKDGTHVSFFKADDYFFYARGVASTLHTILEAVHVDFHTVIESRRGGEVLHHAVVSLKEAMEIDPLLVTDSSLGGILANHRANMAAPISHARFYIGVLIKTLST